MTHKDYFGEARMSEQAIVFDDWEAALWADVSREQYRPYREAIVKFRYWLRQTGKPATVEGLGEVETPDVVVDGEERYRNGNGVGGGSGSGHGPEARATLGRRREARVS